MRTFASGPDSDSAPLGVDIDQQGNVWVSDVDCLRVFTELGVLLFQVKLPALARAKIHDSGAVYACTEHGMYIL